MTHSWITLVRASHSIWIKSIFISVGAWPVQLLLVIVAKERIVWNISSLNNYRDRFLQLGRIHFLREPRTLHCPKKYQYFYYIFWCLTMTSMSTQQHASKIHKHFFKWNTWYAITFHNMSRCYQKKNPCKVKYMHTISVPLVVVEDRPPPHMIVKRFGCTTIHKKRYINASSFIIIHSILICSAKFVLLLLISIIQHWIFNYAFSISLFFHLNEFIVTLIINI